MIKCFSKIVVYILIVSLTSCSLVHYSNAKEGYSEKSKSNEIVGEVGGYLAARSKSAKIIYDERFFNNPVGGNGFAAEEANNLTDRLRGKNATIVGRDLVKDGPDRMIKNRDGSVIWIQDKYWKTASQSVEAAFDSKTGNYRYIDNKGKPMKLEVPKEQYAESVSRFEEKIKAGKVPNTTDPKEAKNIVRQGRYTFKQSVNITKAFNKDSIIYDAKKGTLTSLSAMGISFVLNYASCIINGQNYKDAIKYSSLEALKMGGAVFASHIIASQLAKTSLNRALAPASEAIVRCFGKKFAHSLLKAVGENAAKLTEEQLFKNAAKVLSSKIMFNVAFIVILEIPDIIDIFKGRISKEQFIKNLAVTLSGFGGAALGTAIGTAVAPGAGTAAGLIVGVILGTASALAADKIADYIYEDDADRMFKIVTKEFQVLGEEYLVTKKEADEIVADVKGKFTADVLKDMFASEDESKYAKKLLEPYFKKKIEKRKKIDTPSEEDVRLVYKKSLQGIVYIH